ncbi:BRO-N domain-containing protein [Pseudomonas nitroreducens]|uniref:BRO-N domain-containing protein n=1 Tax=Pseudomonas nitroreducens TaxID=46680 RepID=UPI00265975CF|nr:BRO family protein [Pseudomonas nitroreducens]MCP1651783.1 prophage antirepressor-like protein [Pseudomonas nitroreducens]MCP1689589.1 prophage antirepressor-like protein [Pseudomonas nitroreducens]
MTMPVLFEFEAVPVRVIIQNDGENWFCAKDVCEVLGYSNTSQTITDHCREKGVSKRYTLTDKGRQELQFIDEGNLYRLIIKSRKEEAKRFESWVCDQVLPALRKTGSYQTANRSTATARISNHRLRLSLAKELYRTRDRELRALIHQQLADVSNSLGLPVPELDSLGYSAPTAPNVVASFWQALDFLAGKEVDFNHANPGNLLAVNLPELARLLIEHGQPMRFDSALRQGLWQSKMPRCLHKNHPVSSRLTGKTIRCWVFERTVK